MGSWQQFITVNPTDGKISAMLKQSRNLNDHSVLFDYPAIRKAMARRDLRTRVPSSN
jgi:hypothetical protein